MSKESLIKVEGLVKTYITKESQGLLSSKRKEVHALQNVSFEVHEGEVFGLLGPNGAGKTTLIKILTTLLLPDAGRASLFGYDVVNQPNEVKKRIGVMLMGERTLYWKLTGRENLKLFGRLYKVQEKELEENIEEIIDFLGMGDFADRLVETYSSGQKVMLAFAKSLVNDAPLLFLDEPTVTLDPKKRIEVRRKIKQLTSEGKTIFLTTHLMYEADELCDRVAIMDNGKIMAIGPPDELKATLEAEYSLVVEFTGGDVKRLTQRIEEKENVSKTAWTTVEAEEGEVAQIRAICDSPRDVLGSVIEILHNNGVTIHYIKPKEPTLEDVFLNYTGKLLRGEK